MDHDPYSLVSLSLDFSLGYTVFGIFTVFLLIFLSALMSGAEVAFFGLDEKARAQLLKSTSSKSKRIVRLLEKPNYLLATVNVGNIFVGLCIVILSSTLINRALIFHSATVDILFNVVIITFLILLFGEIIPKVLANHKSLLFARFVVGFIDTVSKILRPVTYLLVKAASIMERNVIYSEQQFSLEDLSTAVNLSNMPSKENQKILKRLIRFRETTVREIMTQRVDVVTIEDTINFKDLKEKIIEWEYSRVPVYQDDIDHIIGVLHLKDILPYIEETETFNWQTLLRNPLYVPENKKISHLLEEFKEKKIHVAIVVDEYGGFCGIVTLEDVLEEVIGEINDESDSEQSNYVLRPDGTYVFEGKTPIHDFSQVFSLPQHYFDEIQGDSETIGGLLIEYKGDFLQCEEQLVVKDFKFIVHKIEGYRIQKIIVTYTKPSL